MRIERPLQSVDGARNPNGLVSYSESRHAAGSFVGYRNVFNVTRHALGNRRQEAVHLVGFAFGKQFNPSVRQVAHVAGNGKSLCESLRRVAKPDALDRAGIVYTLADNHTSICLAATRQRSAWSTRSAGASRL